MIVGFKFQVSSFKFRTTQLFLIEAAKFASIALSLNFKPET
jgi:hypothetical protein